ncbi:MAG: hypothetical protein K5897_08350, partial [Eubacterium sp.]|nr:hypothetical protein [Eubacterium sp.]
MNKYVKRVLKTWILILGMLFFTGCVKTADVSESEATVEETGELPPLTLRLEVGASCFIDPGYYHTTWQFSHDLHKRYGSASSSPTVI